MTFKPVQSITRHNNNQFSFDWWELKKIATDKNGNSCKRPSVLQSKELGRKSSLDTMEIWSIIICFQNILEIKNTVIRIY